MIFFEKIRTDIRAIGRELGHSDFNNFKEEPFCRSISGLTRMEPVTTGRTTLQMSQ